MKLQGKYICKDPSELKDNNAVLNHLCKKEVGGKNNA